MYNCTQIGINHGATMEALNELLRQETPADISAERAIIASVLVCTDALLLERLHPRDFADATNSTVVSELQDMIEAGQPITVDAVARWLRGGVRTGELAGTFFEDNPAAWLAEIGAEFVTQAHDDYYLTVLRNERLRRGLFWMAVNLIDRNKAEDRDPEKTLDWAVDNIALINEAYHDNV